MHQGVVNGDFTKTMEMTMSNGIKLTKIAASLKMTSKNARAKMRRLTVPKGLTVGDDWTFNAKGAAWAKNMLKRDLRKKTA